MFSAGPGIVLPASLNLLMFCSFHNKKYAYLHTNKRLKPIVDDECCCGSPNIHADTYKRLCLSLPLKFFLYPSQRIVGDQARYVERERHHDGRETHQEQLTNLTDGINYILFQYYIFQIHSVWSVYFTCMLYSSRSATSEFF